MTYPFGHQGDRGREYLTLAEAAAVLRQSDRTIRRWVKSGRVAATRVGRQVLIRWSEVERLTNEGNSSHEG